ncbi:bifunctional [glutamate--ammonia ligase]-adenylyl-L-tyrosine phosphorylase/[glutamate--ammonia-ligase] adenylyltransferase [Azomonas macrocytogenes]|uniref:Bifunctional glutamine synthetase adenylyltransferase/adenylyl-removing enzyme n=1 Tax=Azomonas macrocytogenes TaxID=69962 RepID=A0A839T2Z1_AZOMA|nr:bifunctional [glutamate--ammonia ligase]-adenylyl-L-tyrosine phosphorylase/[glutamate--ammonia-ligase] adenylyltransferase [Azomonas macrocytogenes]MBB3102734.1 glutamate-ammonia-ligase adenylyltransferase [Azomonas macrocytogenes]
MNLPQLPVLPDLLLPLARRGTEILSRARDASPDCEALLPATWPQARQQALARVCACSDFVVVQLDRCPWILAELLERKILERSLAPGEIAADLQARLQGCDDEAELMRILRDFRNLHQVRIVWRDLNRQADLIETCRDLSALADSCIDQACQWLYPRLCTLYGTPLGQDGQPQRMVILGMGKLGAFELNLSSDVDLIFAFPQRGETVGASRTLDNQTFFIRLGQRLIKVLDAVTIDGFVFRVDMRLRPYGASGALAFSFAALDEYYREHGRDWERYALIKARVVSGDQQASDALLQMLQPFVYRRYLDFSAIESLREMKRLIQFEVQRKGLAENIKLGGGGIREVEFIAQVFQLIHGGYDPALQQRALLDVLTTLRQHGYLRRSVVAELADGYRFLRYVEHALQAIADRQTHTLPHGEADRARVACMLGCADWTAFCEQLAFWRERIDKHFQRLITKPAVGWSEPGVAEWRALWCENWTETAVLPRLQQAGFRDAESAWQRLCTLRDSAQVRGMQVLGRERLDIFMPCMLLAIAEQSEPDQVLVRVLPLVEGIARRSRYIVLLLENRAALRRLLSLCGASAWIAEQITRFPVLLDELLDAKRLYNPPAAAELAYELNGLLLRLPEDDLEQQMETLRRFKQAHRLRVAVSEIVGTLPLMKVSDYLTWLAEAILEQVLALAWRQLVARYGQPRCSDGSPCDPGFLVLGYGKVGGIELGHESDLDLVFIHNGEPGSETDGIKLIDSAQFFIRLGQRMIHLLSTQTASGRLYEVDMRLRPSGAAGLLVSSMTAYEHYQSRDAWTWEHQALVRARPLSGCPRLAREFLRVRGAVLGRARDLQTLRVDVSEMRARMRANLGTRSTAAGTAGKAFSAQERFDLKHDAGGIVDIEFMVQYAVLAWSHRYPELLRHTDNIRILDGLAQTGLLSGTEVRLLQEAYKAYRIAAHRLSLQKQSGVVSGDRFHDERQAVMRIWRELGLF